MILSNLSVPLLGMVDTGVTGHLDDAAYLGAVAIGAAIFGVLYSGVNFLRMGTTGITAQRFGADDDDGIRNALGQAIIAAMFIAALLIVCRGPIGGIAMHLLRPSPDVAVFADTYFSIRIWSAPATLASYALIGWFLGLQNARVPLVIVLAINISNIVLDLVFVLGLGMHVDGVAAASVIAEYIGVVVGLWYVHSELRRRGGHFSRKHLLSIREYSGFAAINGHLFVRTMALMFTFSFITAQGARFGGLILAANAILMNLQLLLSFGLDGFAHAAEALVGKAVGARDRHAVQQAVNVSLQWSLYVASGYTALFLLAGPLVIALLTDLPDVREASLRYLPWLIVSPLVSVWSFLYDGVFVGATRARDMRNIMVGSTVLVFLPAWYLFRFLGNDGLWLAFILFMASRGVGMYIAYRHRVLPSIPAN